MRSDAGLTAFLAALRGYLRFFFDELGGQATTPSRLYRALSDQPQSSGAAGCTRLPS